MTDISCLKSKCNYVQNLVYRCLVFKPWLGVFAKLTNSQSMSVQSANCNIQQY